ncbi:hypothetical protein C4K09_3499 [Pseudomonas chlororaphis subsp. aureofaciens]|nr:hypothetical protein C4K09_3499 [Pseudomonas chlororaphis subsp. aureofaciens]
MALRLPWLGIGVERQSMQAAARDKSDKSQNALLLFSVSKET